MPRCLLLPHTDVTHASDRHALAAGSRPMSDEVARSCFFDLPGDVLAQISAGSPGLRLLALSRRGRDVVLERARAVQLNFLMPAAFWLPSDEPAARLLDRACRAAAPGLQVEINIGNPHTGHGFSHNQTHRLQSSLLSALLQRGRDAGGWGNVHVLSLVVVRAAAASTTHHPCRRSVSSMQPAGV